MHVCLLLGSGLVHLCLVCQASLCLIDMVFQVYSSSLLPFTLLLLHQAHTLCMSSRLECPNTQKCTAMTRRARSLLGACSGNKTVRRMGLQRLQQVLALRNSAVRPKICHDKSGYETASASANACGWATAGTDSSSISMLAFCG